MAERVKAMGNGTKRGNDGEVMEATDREVDLWVAVIHQALDDASMGIHYQIRKGRLYPKPKRLNLAMTWNDVLSARSFIKCENDSFRDIVQAMGGDFDYYRGIVLSQYKQYQRWLPSGLRDGDVDGQDQNPDLLRCGNVGEVQAWGCRP